MGEDEDNGESKNWALQTKLSFCHFLSAEKISWTGCYCTGEVEDEEQEESWLK